MNDSIYQVNVMTPAIGTESKYGRGSTPEMHNFDMELQQKKIERLQKNLD